MSGYGSGLKGEEAAERCLQALGMTTVARRYRAADGEIDLIMRDGETLVFVEVKYRPAGRPGDGLAAVGAAKRRRMTHAAAVFLLEGEYSGGPVRFDVVEITGAGALHVPNAFPAQL